tara:strand:- start:67 stop:231 length:165 start_codon:yes stop_codon:yes gene_type:complete
MAAAIEAKVDQGRGEMPPVVPSHLAADELTKQGFCFTPLMQGDFTLLQCRIHGR